MIRHVCSVWLVGCTTAILASSAQGQQPTFSLEVVAINGAPLPEGSATQTTAVPGDQLTTEVYLRDWSPQGQKLSAYQAQLEPVGFTSGAAGFIEPKNYQEVIAADSDNPAHCFIDQKNPKFVHTGLATLALADTRSEGYRMASILLGGQGPVSDQKGTKFYCGTVHFQVSDNAQGTFKISLMEDDEASGLREADGSVIGPVQFEPLLVEVLKPTDRSFMSRLVERMNRGDGAPTDPGSNPTQVASAKVPDFTRIIEKLNARK